MRREDLAEAVRERLLRLPPPYAAHYGVAPAPPSEGPIDITPIRPRYDAALAALGRAETIAGEMPDPWAVSRVLTRREAVSSSAIEGTNSTLDELLVVEETEDEEATAAARQVRSYAMALDDLLPAARDAGPAFFSVDRVRALHRSVMRADEGYQDIPGDLRQRVVWIGGGADIAYSTYNPTPPANVEACLADSVAYLAQQGLHSDGMLAVNQGLITRMAIAHAHFEAVHPFRDGNGRVGRLLLPLMMAADRVLPLYLSPYIEAHKDAYYDALKAAQRRLDWLPIIGFVADSIVRTVEELQVTNEALVRLVLRWTRAHEFRSGSSAQNALWVLPHFPVITVMRLCQALQVTFPAGSNAIKQLVAAGILVERTGRKRNRVYSAPEVLAIINRPFGAEPIVVRETASG